jgi:solute carrier family 9B (sodium/hydrogen exchanger), member 1/2
VTFRGKGMLVPFFVIIPNLVEATISALMALELFQMPIEVAYCLGYACTSLAASITVPQMITLNEEGYGKKKGIPSTLIASATFDNITTIIWFGITKAITFS